MKCRPPDDPAAEMWAPIVGVVCLALLVFVGLPRSEAPPQSCDRPELLASSDSEAGFFAVSCRSGSERDAPSGRAGLLFGIPIDVNRASQRDLEALPGIGPARALAILRSRERGPFCALRELDRVSGIGAKRVKALIGWAQANCDVPLETGSRR